MSVQDSVDLAFDTFGGYVTSIPPSMIPPGSSPLAQDVAFPMGSPKTRPGTGTGIMSAGTAAFNGLLSFQPSPSTKRTIAWASDGTLYRENPTNTLVAIAGPTVGSPNLFMQGRQAFARAYLAFFNALGGVDIPRQFDDVNYDRVSAQGPGEAPSAKNFLPTVSTIANPGVAAGVAIVSVTRSVTASYQQSVPVDATGDVPDPSTLRGGGGGGILLSDGQGIVPNAPAIRFQLVTISYSTLVTVNTGIAAHGLIVGQSVLIAGVTDNSFNGTFIVNTVIDANNYTYLQDGSLGATSSGGTSTAVPASVSRASNILTITTAAVHGYNPGWTVVIAGVADIAVGGASSATQQGGVVTVTTASPHGLIPGALVVITAATDATYNGVFTVQTVPNTLTFTYNQTTSTTSSAAVTPSTRINGTYKIKTTTSTTFSIANLGPNVQASPAGATATIVGNITPGLHQLSVAFITRQNSITRPAPPMSFIAAGNQLASITNIPTGPANVIGRLLLFTKAILAPASTGQFLSIGSMLINDNTTTNLVIDFSDTALAGGQNSQQLFSQVLLGECANVQVYSNRLSWIGERATLPNLVNLTFDGGFNLGGGVGGSDRPLGWISDASFGAGGVRVIVPNFGEAYRITGDGVAQFRGLIRQTAYQDFLGVNIFNINTSYSVRVRAFVNTLSSAGNLVIDLFSNSLGIAIGAATIPISSLGTTQQEFIVSLLTPQANLPSDLQLRVFTSAFVANGVAVTVKNIEPFITSNPINSSQARISFAFNQEAYHQTTGIVTVRANDGQTLRAQFKIRENLYLAKDFYLASVKDDGQNEPAFWQPAEVSETIGICGPNAVDTAEEWAVFANRQGLYIFWGSDPIKISQEVQEDISGLGKIAWNSINWAAQHTIWVRIDQLNKRILVGVPTGSATTPNKVMAIDYKFQITGQSLAEAMTPVYSHYSGRLITHGSGRRWAVWNVTANSAALVERTDGTAHMFLGNGGGNGKIYDLLDSNKQDDAVAINSIYQTYAQPASHEEQALQLTAHRKLCDYLTGRAVGSGTLLVSAITPYRTATLRGIALSISPLGDFERNVNIHGERIIWQISTNAVGDWFQLEKFIPSIKPDPMLPVRGLGA